MAVNVFISSAPEDQTLQEEFTKHLSTLRTNGVIHDWSVNHLLAGSEWEMQMRDHLNAAHIILLLISSHFFASDHCYSIEMPLALGRYTEQHVRIIPILLRPCFWENTLLTQFKVLPTNKTPITCWTNRDEAFIDVVKSIAQVIDEFQGNISSSENAEDDLRQKHTASPDAASTPNPAPSIQNVIGSISGNNHTISQVGTQQITTHYLYGSPSEIRRFTSFNQKRQKRKRTE